MAFLRFAKAYTFSNVGFFALWFRRMEKSIFRSLNKKEMRQ